MSTPIKIGIIDDHFLVREGLISLLGNFKEISVVFDVDNGKELMEALKKHPVDVILLDIELPVMSGGEAFEKIKVKYPNLKVIIISSHFKDLYVIEFIRKGVSAFLSKNSRAQKIVEAIKSVFETGTYFDTAVSLIMAKAISNPTKMESGEERPDLDLSFREIQIIKYISQGRSSSEIANSLSLSIRTVEWHRRHIWKKTQCKSPTELISYAIQHNLVSVL